MRCWVFCEFLTPMGEGKEEAEMFRLPFITTQQRHLARRNVAGFTTRSLTPIVTTWGRQFFASTSKLLNNLREAPGDSSGDCPTEGVASESRWLGPR